MYQEELLEIRELGVAVYGETEFNYWLEESNSIFGEKPIDMIKNLSGILTIKAYLSSIVYPEPDIDGDYSMNINP